MDTIVVAAYEMHILDFEVWQTSSCQSSLDRAKYNRWFLGEKNRDRIESAYEKNDM